MKEGLNPLRELDANYTYSVSEIATMWNLAEETIRRLFEDEPGVLIFENIQSQPKKKRRYRILRIPGAVAIAVRNRFTVVS